MQVRWGMTQQLQALLCPCGSSQAALEVLRSCVNHVEWERAQQTWLVLSYCRLLSAC